jgi:hypothetical protein
MAWLFEEILQKKKRFNIRAVLGNHDEAFAYDQNQNRFFSKVSPCEFSEQLNRHLENPRVVAFGKNIEAFFKRLPRMVTINNDIMVAHGGVPHTDIQPKITTKSDLESAEALRDFIWVRLHERAPERYPNRESAGAEIGHKDFANFIDITRRVLDFTPRNFVRGHDHVEGNFQHLENYRAARVFTINAFSFRKRYGIGSPFRPPVILRYDPTTPSQENNFTVFKFDLPQELVEKGRKLKSFIES